LAVDENGHLIRENLVSLHVMRKEKGFGADYKEFQSGEWEYVGYNPDGSILNAPEATGFCAACHAAALDEKTDFTFRALQVLDHEQMFTQILPGPMQPLQMVVMAEVGYGPNNLRIKPGTTVVFNNFDLVNHTVTARDGSFDSGIKAPNSTFSMIFDQPGSYAYFCSLHPAQMTGTITVAE
jgi:plastocyanin